jgi:hypothetical protein
VAVIVVQDVPQGKVMVLLGIVNTVAGFCDQEFNATNKKENSKALRLIRNQLIQKFFLMNWN